MSHPLRRSRSKRAPVAYLPREPDRMQTATTGASPPWSLSTRTTQKAPDTAIRHPTYVPAICSRRFPLRSLRTISPMNTAKTAKAAT